MVERKYEVGHEERVRRHLQVLYARETRERQIFIEDLKAYRKRHDKQLFHSIIVAVGPKWYQTLSMKQRDALDTLEICIYQDLLEGRPVRTATIMHKLGLIPCPSFAELMPCISLGRNDPKEMLAQLYLSMYGYPINGKRTSYCLNARLVLSAILYLGFDNLIYLLQKTFAPDVSTPKPERKPKRKPKVELKSPYLANLVAALYVPPQYHRKPPAPLPDLTELNEPYVEEPIMQKPPPPPPPPPPPKKRIPISLCEKMADINKITAYSSPTKISTVGSKMVSKRKIRSKSDLPAKKKYGICMTTEKKNTRRKKLQAPPTVLWNTQYTINGVYKVNGKTCFVLGNVSVLPAQGDLIHGGYAFVKGQCFTIHCGYRGYAPKEKPQDCDCVKKWQDAVFKYVKDTKCDCGHHYDYQNEGNFSPEELPYFIKPTRHAPFTFEYDTIFNLDMQKLHIEKEFRRVWNTESLLRVDDADNFNKVIDKKKKKKKAEKSEIEEKDLNKDAVNDVAAVEDDTSKAKQLTDQRPSQTCLGLHPKVTDYLKCALQLMRKVNVAARLPDLHLVPELREWMRQRLYGRFTSVEKKEYLRKSSVYWGKFATRACKGIDHVYPPEEPIYRCPTTWKHKQSLNETFKHFTRRYKLSLFRSHAYENNLLWRTMYQAEFPDKKFREIYFSYMCGSIEDMQLLHPYSTLETEARKTIINKRRYLCPPAGLESAQL